MNWTAYVTAFNKIFIITINVEVAKTMKGTFSIVWESYIKFIQVERQLFIEER